MLNGVCVKTTALCKEIGTERGGKRKMTALGETSKSKTVAKWTVLGKKANSGTNVKTPQRYFLQASPIIKEKRPAMDICMDY